MARQVRVEYAGAMYHVLARGNNRQAIFRNEEMRHRFLDTLAQACEQTGWNVHAYVLMTNHYHLLLETPEANLVAGMKWLQGTYTQRFNRALGRSGHLFQGRYKALVLDPEEDGCVQRISTYIHLNPFRARICGAGTDHRLESHRWSSYPKFLTPGREHPPWLVVERVLESVGIRGSAKLERERYRQWIEARMAYEVDPRRADAVRSERRSLQRGWYLGGEEFRNWILEQVVGRSDNLRGGQRREHGEHAAEKLLAAGLSELGVREDKLLIRKSTDAEKQALAWLLKKHTTVTAVWLAGRLQMGHRVNASRAISRFDQATDKETKRLKARMLQCTG